MIIIPCPRHSSLLTSQVQSLDTWIQSSSCTSLVSEIVAHHCALIARLPRRWHQISGLLPRRDGSTFAASLVALHLFYIADHIASLDSPLSLEAMLSCCSSLVSFHGMSSLTRTIVSCNKEHHPLIDTLLLVSFDFRFFYHPSLLLLVCGIGMLPLIPSLQDLRTNPFTRR